MRCIRCILLGLLVILAVTLLIWLGMTPATAISDSPKTPGTDLPARNALRIGLIPERDIFEQRRRYRALVDCLSSKLDRPVELLTVSSYEGVMQDLREKQVDAAFLGSLVAVLAADRMSAQILAKPELPDHTSTYRGVIFVPERSAIQSIDDLAGKSIAMVRTTTAGHLYPFFELSCRGMLSGPKAPKIVWVGTHDDVILEVANGHVDAGAVKDRRLDEYEQKNPAVKVRRLGTSQPVPENALVASADLSKELVARLQVALLEMGLTEPGQAALREFGATRFLPCRIEDYRAIYDMAGSLSGGWDTLGISGPPLKWPASSRIRERH